VVIEPKMGIPEGEWVPNDEKVESLKAKGTAQSNISKKTRTYQDQKEYLKGGEKMQGN